MFIDVNDVNIDRYFRDFNSNRASTFAHERSMDSFSGTTTVKMEAMNVQLNAQMERQIRIDLECGASILMDEWDVLDGDALLDNYATHFFVHINLEYPGTTLPIPLTEFLSEPRYDVKCAEAWPKDITYNKTKSTRSGLLQRIIYKRMFISTCIRNRASRLWVKWCEDDKLLSQKPPVQVGEV